VERHSGAESSAIAAAIGASLLVFVKACRLGHVFAPDSGYRCFAADPDKVRKPDVSFVVNGRLPNDQPPKGYSLIAPDLAVEVLSPGDIADDVEEKVQEYLAAGVKLVWVVSPVTQTVRIHRPTSASAGPIAMLRSSDIITGEDVIPGFECKVAEFFDI
jgi:Uma2 family endonuclease